MRLQPVKFTIVRHSRVFSRRQFLIWPRILITMRSKVSGLSKQHNGRDFALNYRPSDLKSNTLTTTPLPLTTCTLIDMIFNATASDATVAYMWGKKQQRKNPLNMKYVHNIKVFQLFQRKSGVIGFIIYLIFTIKEEFVKFLKFVKLSIVKCLPPKSQNKMPWKFLEIS